MGNTILMNLTFWDIVFFLIAYGVNAVYIRFIFEVVGVNKNLAWIPVYNTYRVYKEYSGRVWNANWGVMYMLINILAMLSIFNIGAQYFRYIFLLLAFSGIGVVLLAIIIIVHVQLIYKLYCPVLEGKGSKYLLIVYIIIRMANYKMIYILPYSFWNESTVMALNVVVLASEFIFNVVAYKNILNIRKKVNSGDYAVKTVIDKSKYSAFEIKEKLNAQDKSLIDEVKFAE